MAVTITKPTGLKRTRGYAAPLRMNLFDVAFSGSYATGGEAITAAQVGLNTIVGVYGIVTEAAGATSARPIRWDPANLKLQLYGAAVGVTGATEMAAGAYNASTAGRLMFVGT